MNFILFTKYCVFPETVWISDYDGVQHLLNIFEEWLKLWNFYWFYHLWCMHLLCCIMFLFAFRWTF